MKRLHFQSLAAKASETKKDELELDLRIRHYHSAKKTNNVNHRNTAYSLKYTEKNCEGTSGNVFWTKIKAQERASFQNISPTMADFCAVVSTLLFGVSFCLESGSQVERQKRQKAYLNSKKKKNRRVNSSRYFGSRHFFSFILPSFPHCEAWSQARLGYIVHLWLGLECAKGRARHRTALQPK